MYQNYIFFLFCELARIKSKELTKEPYDIQFPVFVDLYNEYTQSPQSEQNKSEYDCIIDFLNDKELERKLIIKDINTIISEQLPLLHYDNKILYIIKEALNTYNKTKQI
jgi:hypothetical protein